MKPGRLPLLALVVAIGLLAGCHMPLGATPTPALEGPASTAAAETVAVMLTQVAQAAAATAAAPGLATATGPEEEAATSTPPPPTATATETATPSPTLPPPPTAPAALDPRQQLGAPTWQDRFANGDSWPLYTDENVAFTVSGGRLQMVSRQAKGWDSWLLPQPELEDFYLEVTASPAACSGLDRYGLLARAPDPNQVYLFGFTCDGQYSLRVWDGNTFTILVPWTPSQHIVAGANQTNRLGFMARGSHFGLYANGILLAELDDETLAGGRFGLFVGSANTPDFTVNVTEVAYWDLP